jgi:hypothetical protein
MLIMGCRLLNLQYIIDGFLRTKIPLVLYDGISLLPFLVYDDIGIYVFIPKLVRFFDIPLEQAINIFFYGLVAVSFFLAALGFLLVYQTRIQQLFSMLGLCLLFCFFIRFQISDVYLGYMITALSIIPLFLFFITRKKESSLFYFFLFFSGIILGTFHYIRAHSGLAVLTLMIIMILFNNGVHLKKKIALMGCLFLGIVCPYYYFHAVVTTYQTYAHEHFPESRQLLTEHPFWHSAYIGFGFLNFCNDENIRYDDSCAYEKVKKQNPSLTIYQTKEYEEILKKEVYLLWKKQPFFVLFTLFAKIGILLFFFLIFCNVGILAALYSPKQWSLELAFLAAFCINSLFPLMANPNFHYSIGFITLATLYGIISFNEVLKITVLKNLFFSLRKIIAQCKEYTCF